MILRRPLIIAGALLAAGLLLFGLRGAWNRTPSLASDPAAGSGATQSLPLDFAQRLRDRVVLDINQQSLHAVDQELLPSPRELSKARPVDDANVRIVTTAVPREILAYRQSLPDNHQPLRGFRAPILDQRTNLWPSLLQTARCDVAALNAAAAIEQKIHSDGLLLNLARTLQTLGPTYLTNSPASLLEVVRGLGFPVDLLACFALDSTAPTSPEAAVGWMARQLMAGKSLTALEPELKRVTFHFQKAWPGFQIATEGGEAPLGMLRMQFGGGYREGIIPGGTLDVACQLVNALPDVDFLISVPQTVLSPVEAICRNHLSLTRPGQLTLVAEPLPMSAWAQDNGKAGVRKTDHGIAWATLVPRYANKGEGSSTFLPGDTFLADGLAAAGHEVAQSHLLYQGGNLLAVREPDTGRRLLLAGEAVLHQNTALGLTPAQVQEALQIEFEVDQCQFVPAVSFHIDFDFSVRVQGNRVIAFVNDPFQAARLILQAGATMLERQRLLPMPTLEAIRGAIQTGNDRTLFEALAPVVYGHLNAKGQFPAALARHFKAAPEDAPSENLRCFLVALEIVGSRVLTGPAAPRDPTMRDYLAALERLWAAAARQIAELRKLKWEIVAVPSTPDLTPSLNYLNGLHDSTRFLVPVYGGFYSEVDAAALKIIQAALGPSVRVIPFLSAECQRQHGGVHCATAAYPRW